MSPAKRKKPPALPPAKNYWTEKSIQFAQTANYLDELFRVYPINPELERTLDPEIWNDVKKNLKKRKAMQFSMHTIQN